MGPQPPKLMGLTDPEIINKRSTTNIMTGQPTPANVPPSGNGWETNG